MNPVTSPSQHADVFAIMELAMQEASTDRQAARATRDEAFDHEIGEKEHAIEEQRKAAEDRFSAGIADAAGKMTEGAFGVAGDVVTLCDADEGETGGSLIKEFGKAESAALGFVKANSTLSADLHDASAKTHEKNATVAHKVVEDARDNMNEARRVQQGYIDMAKQIAEKQDQARLAIVRG